MDVLQTVAGPLTTIVVMTIAGYLLKERFDRLEARVDDLPTRKEVDARFEAIDARFEAVDHRLGRLESETAILRSDLTHIALAVGARPTPQTG